MKKIFFCIVCIVIGYSSFAYAIPELQIYIDAPDTTYVGSNPSPWLTESWFTDYSSFDLWVIGGTNNISKLSTISNVHLIIAVPWLTSGGSIVLDSQTDGFADKTYYASDFIYGNPFGKDKSHGVYDTWYLDHHVGDLVLSAATPVQDMVEGSSDKPGKIVTYAFTKNGFVAAHFDLIADGGLFSKFSHDGQDGEIPPVPEPASLLLLGIGICGFGISKKKLWSRKKA